MPCTGANEPADKPEITACSLVTTKPEENGTGSLGAQGHTAAGNTVSTTIQDDTLCEGVGDVVGVKAPLGGVAQVIFHGVQVVEVGVQVRVHQDRGEEEDGEGQVEVEREVGEDQGEPHMCDMA